MTLRFNFMSKELKTSYIHYRCHHSQICGVTETTWCDTNLHLLQQSSKQISAGQGERPENTKLRCPPPKSCHNFGLCRRLRLPEKDRTGQDWRLEVRKSQI